MAFLCNFVTFDGVGDFLFLVVLELMAGSKGVGEMALRKKDDFILSLWEHCKKMKTGTVFGLRKRLRLVARGWKGIEGQIYLENSHKIR